MGCVINDSSVPTLSSINDLSKILTVATLNYCGIMNSPFEFYCDDYMDILEEIGDQYKILLEEYFPQYKEDKKNFKWNMGKIDLKYRNRYSPMFLLVGITEQNKIMTKQEFESRWESVFNSDITELKIEFTPEQKEVTKKYDVLMFHTLLRYVYGVKQINDATQLNTKLYRKKLEPLYNASFLDEDRKCKKVVDNLQRINADVFFLQEYSQNFFDEVQKLHKEDFHIVHESSKDTAIFAKKGSFTEPKYANNVVFFKDVKEETMKLINWNNRTTFMVIDNYIFLNAHLSSKQEPNKKQIEDLKKGIVELKNIFKDYDIVLAGDLNSYLQPFSSNFYFFPDKKEQMTTIKKRTVTQGQFNKADKIVSESKDKIISTMKILDGKILYINGAEPSKNNLVPTEEHPFDHFVVVANLEKRQS